MLTIATCIVKKITYRYNCQVRKLSIKQLIQQGNIIYTNIISILYGIKKLTVLEFLKDSTGALRNFGDFIAPFPLTH